MTSISLRMDETLKKQFEGVCNELGMSMSTAFTIFAKATVRRQGMPFDVVVGESYDINIVKKLQEAQAQAAETDVRLTLGEVLSHARSAIDE